MIRAISSAAQGSGISLANAVTGSLGTPLTRGGLVAATLSANVSEEDVKIPCHFNPSEIAISKSIAYEPHKQVGRNIPNLEFTQGDSRTLNLTLWFDSTTTLANENIRKTTDKLWKFALVDPATEDANTKVGTPPIVTFTWEQLSFKGVVTSMTHTYVLFSELGAPLRAKVALTIKQNSDDTISEPQTSTSASKLRALRAGAAAMSGMLGAVMALSAAAVSAAASSSNSSSSKSASKKPASASSGGVMAQEGTRIDHVAAATTGDSANQRQVAENNNIDNPMKLPKGKVIR